MDQYLDLIIPRGGERLIRLVCAEATMPVLKHYKGVCHLYVDRECDVEKAVEIVVNAKVQRPSACNALETLLIDRKIAERFVPPFVAAMKENGVELRGDEEFRKLDPEAVPATEDDYYAEYLSLILTVKTVGSVEEAVEHINQYGSRHSDGILSDIPADIDYFFANVDSSTLYANASTRFTDGGQFGFGGGLRRLLLCLFKADGRYEYVHSAYGKAGHCFYRVLGAVLDVCADLMQLVAVFDYNVYFNRYLFFIYFYLNALGHALFVVEHSGDAFNNSAGHTFYAFDLGRGKAGYSRYHIRCKGYPAALNLVQLAGNFVICCHNMPSLFNFSDIIPDISDPEKHHMP